MYKFKLARVRAKDLKEFIEILPPNVFAEKGLKVLKLAMNALDDLADQNKAHVERIEEFNARQKKYIEPMQEKVTEINKKKEAANPEDKAALDAEIQVLVQESNADIEKVFGEESKAINEAGLEVVEFQLSDEKFPVVKSVFEEQSLKVFNNTKTVLAISEGLDAAVKE